MSHVRHRYILCMSTLVLGIFLFSSNSAFAEDSDGDLLCKEELSLEEFRALVLHKSPVVFEIDSDYAKRLGDAIQLKQMINPDIYLEQTYTTMNIGGANDSQASVSLGQPIRLSDFGVRNSVASLISKAGEMDKKVKILELIQSLSVKFKTLYEYQKLKDFLISASRRAKSKLDLVRSGASKGLFPKSDEFLFEGEMHKLHAQIENTEFLLSSLRSELSQMSGVKCGIRAGRYEVTKLNVSLETLLEKAESSELSFKERSRILLDLSREQEKLASRDTVPIITPRFVYQHTNDGGDFFGAGISIPIPLFNRNQAQKIVAKAEMKLNESRLAIIEDGGLQNQVRHLYKSLSHTDRQLIILKDKVLPAYENSLVHQERLYSEGKGSILQVWAVFKEYNATYAHVMQLSLDAMTSRIQLSTLIGEEL